MIERGTKETLGNLGLLEPTQREQTCDKRRKAQFARKLTDNLGINFGNLPAHVSASS